MRNDIGKICAVPCCNAQVITLFDGKFMQDFLPNIMNYMDISLRCTSMGRPQLGAASSETDSIF